MNRFTTIARDLVVSTLGTRIRFYRNKAGLTQKQLAQGCGLSESAIRNYELDNRIPDQATLSKIAEVLKVNYYTLADSDPTATAGAVHAIFDMEKLYGLHPEMVNGKLCIVTERDTDKNDAPAEFYKAMKEWLAVYNIFKAGNLDEQSYFEWQAKFPEQ